MPAKVDSLGWFRHWLLDLPRYTKRTLLVVLDFCTLSVLLAGLMSVRYGQALPLQNWLLALTLLAAPLLVVVTFGYAGLYRMVTRYLGTRGQTRIIACIAISTLIWALLILMLDQRSIPRSVVLAFGLFAAMTITMSRHMIGWFLKSSGIVLPKLDPNRAEIPVIIYGAAEAGIMLAEAVSRTPDRNVVGFFDNSPTLWGQYIGGVRVYSPDRLGKVIEQFSVKEIVLATATKARHERRRILKDLAGYPVAVKILPSLNDIATGNFSIADLRPLDVADLLGRDSVPPDQNLLTRNTQGKNVLVTGAGGSVGSELARQVLRQRPARLVLFDISEPALYDIDMDLKESVAGFAERDARPDIIAVLGSVVDATLVSDVLQRYGIETIYHAAAYKHVPLVESNAPSGLSNNVFGTEVVAEAAMAAGVERMVLISTDKAVRPTNIMGATKRISELVLQAHAADQAATVFTMVRFGNVLDSSGSVVKRFRKQIMQGGPLTVTHPEVIRYFMSIPEAAELVIQAGAMAQGGDVFVLDMGEPVKIDELARLMVRLSGLDVKDDTNPDGDIEIIYTGLRRGDKLYEELLLGPNTSATEHPRILRSDEPSLASVELKRELSLLRIAIAARDLDAIKAVLQRVVEGYRPDGDDGVADIRPATTSRTMPSRTLH